MFLDTIEDMHYDFKQKLNKIDSQKYRNLLIQEIDWKLNEGMEIFIKTIAEPRKFKDQLGVEVNQRTIDDIRTIVKEGFSIDTTPFDTTTYTVVLPDDYWFMLANVAYGSKGDCAMQALKTGEREHNDLYEDSPFDNSNFEWRETNFVYHSGGLRFFTDGTFSIDKVIIDYIQKPPYMHNAQGVGITGYNLPSGYSLTGKQDCILPPATHREIVDIAILVATGDLQMADYQTKMAKLKLND